MSQIVVAHQKYLRTTPRKLRLVADSLKDQSVAKALEILTFTPKRAAGEIKKVLIQAQKNAVNNSQLNPDTLKVKNIRVDAGPTFKRWQPVSRGRAHSILKRTSHLYIALSGDQNAKPNTPAKPDKSKSKKESNGPKS